MRCSCYFRVFWNLEGNLYITPCKPVKLQHLWIYCEVDLQDIPYETVFKLCQQFLPSQDKMGL